jgi:hypothetical protein
MGTSPPREPPDLCALDVPRSPIPRWPGAARDCTSGRAVYNPWFCSSWLSRVGSSGQRELPQWARPGDELWPSA